MNKLSKQQNSVSTISTLANTNSKEISIYNAYVTDKRLKDFSTKEDLMLINSLIVRWANYVGIATTEATEINMLANFIKEHFSNFNAYDLKECINLLANQFTTLEMNYGVALDTINRLQKDRYIK
jgi:hypothetical protein